MLRFFGYRSKEEKMAEAVLNAFYRIDSNVRNEFLIKNLYGESIIKTVWDVENVEEA